MGMVKKSISVTGEQEAWIKAQIESGDYGNDSEVFRDLIREKQRNNSELDTIRLALITAEGRGISTRTAEDIRQEVQKIMRASGDL